MGKKFHIVLAERPVKIMMARDVRDFGKPFSHPFLVLFNDKGAVEEEVHGTWSRATPMKPVVKLVERFTCAAKNEPFNGILTAWFHPLFPKAHIKTLIGERDHPKATEKQYLASGPESEIRAAWEGIKHNFTTLNSPQTPFYRYATKGSGFSNCQLMLSVALHLSGMFGSTLPPLSLAQTGWQRRYTL